MGVDRPALLLYHLLRNVFHIEKALLWKSRVPKDESTTHQPAIASPHRRIQNTRKTRLYVARPDVFSREGSRQSLPVGQRHFLRLVVSRSVYLVTFQKT